MKKILTLGIFLMVLLVSTETKAQQHYCWGIDYGVGGIYNPNEYCWFDTVCSTIFIDTSNHSNIWQIGKPQKIFFDSAYSQPNAMVTDTANNYPTNNHSYFDIIIPVNYFSNTSVSFIHKFNTDTMKDGGYIEVKYHKDSIWKNIAYDTITYAHIEEFYCENLYGIYDTLYNGIPGFSGNTNWTTTQIQWIWHSPCKKEYEVDTLRLRFHFISDGDNTNKEGWMIDNLGVTGYNLGSNIEENSSENLISVSPNPVSESAIVELKIKGNETYTAELYNIFGQKVKGYPKIKNKTFTIERGNCRSGMYYLILKNADKIIAGRKVLFQ